MKEKFRSSMNEMRIGIFGVKKRLLFYAPLQREMMLVNVYEMNEQTQNMFTAQGDVAVAEMRAKRNKTKKSLVMMFQDFPAFSVFIWCVFFPFSFL